MTVKELIEELKELPPEADIKTNDNEYGLQDVDRVRLDKEKFIVIID